MHRHQWLCTCNKSLETAETFREHMRQEHAGTFTENQLPALTTRAERPLQWIPASACPLCDYESVLRRRLPYHGTDPGEVEPVKVRVPNFRSHLGSHLEQLALFVLPRNDLEEEPSGNVDPEGVNDEEEDFPRDTLESAGGSALDHALDQFGHRLSSGRDPLIPASGEHDHINPTPLSEPDGPSDLLVPDIATNHNRIGVDENIEVKNLDGIEESTGFPDLAMGWQPPMDFWPPEKDFEEEDIDWIPRREEPMFGGDLFTPGWVRGQGSQKQGFCGRCLPGQWHNIENSSYRLDLTYHHGIAPSGIPLPRPSSIRESASNPGFWEGYCDTCEHWQVLRRTHRWWNWFSHCVKVSCLYTVAF